MDLSSLLHLVGPKYATAMFSVFYLIAWAMTLLPVPTAASSRRYRVAYAILNVIAGNVGNARNAAGLQSTAAVPPR